MDHINNIRTDNRLENLQLITHSENNKKDHKKGKSRSPVRVQALNINSEETSDYHSIYECYKSLDIHKESIRRVLDGIYKTATSKKDKDKYTFKRI